jgi:flagellin
MAVINTNINSLNAQYALNINARAQSKAMLQLSTGSRINGAADDSAGLAMSETMTAQIRGLNMAVKNANDGVSLLQTAEGAMVQQTNMLQRMRELAVQASSDTVTSDGLTNLDTEFQALLTEINRIGTNTQWNGKDLLAKTGGAKGDGTYNFQVGANASQFITVTIDKMTDAGALKNISGQDVTTAKNATTAIGNIDSALTAMGTMRATIGATINQLTYAADNLATVSTNASQSRSRLMDTDFAAASSELARTQIIAQAGTAMLAQANQQPQTVLALLK